MLMYFEQLCHYLLCSGVQNCRTGLRFFCYKFKLPCQCSCLHNWFDTLCNQCFVLFIPVWNNIVHKLQIMWMGLKICWKLASRWTAVVKSEMKSFESKIIAFWFPAQLNQPNSQNWKELADAWPNFRIWNLWDARCPNPLGPTTPIITKMNVVLLQDLAW